MARKQTIQMVNLAPTWPEVGRVYRRFAEGEAGASCRALAKEATLAFECIDHAQALANALNVFLLDKRTRAFLDANDAKGVEQAERALAALRDAQERYKGAEATYARLEREERD